MNDRNKQQGSQDKSQGQQQQFQGGEGNYKATRQYNEGLKDHVQHHDIEKDARDAAPKSAAEEREMEEAERIGRSRAKGDSSQTEGGNLDEQDRPLGGGSCHSREGGSPRRKGRIAALFHWIPAYAGMTFSSRASGSCR